MKTYKIIDSSMKEYIIRGNDALDAIISWTEKHRNKKEIDIIHMSVCSYGR